MNDLIKREDAIEAVESTTWYHQNRNKDMVEGANSDEHQAWYKSQDIYEALEAVPSADRPSDPHNITYINALKNRIRKLEAKRPQEWIPCSERLPSKDGKYLIVGRQGAVNILPYRDGRWYGRWGVIAWMPLPKPWKGADDELVE